MAQSAKVNDTATPWEGLEYLQGQGTSLDEAKSQHKIVCLECWATWCPPCRSSIPHLNSLHQKYYKQGVVFIGITNENDKNKLTSFIKGMGSKMTYAVAMDTQDTMQEYNEKYSVRGIPHAFLIDHRGRVRWSGHPMSPDFESMIEQLINELHTYQRQQQTKQQQQEIEKISEEELEKKSIKELITLLKQAGLSEQGCVEKADLIARIKGKSTI